MNLTLLPESPPHDGQAYMDARRDAHLAEERSILASLQGRVEGFTIEDLLRIARRGFVAGARAKADEVMCREAEDRELCELKAALAERRAAMRKELARQARAAEVVPYERLPWPKEWRGGTA